MFEHVNVNLEQSYTEAGHQAGQVDVSWRKHMQLLQTGDRRRLNQRVRVILHDGAAHQTRRADRRDAGAVAWENKRETIKILLCVIHLLDNMSSHLEQKGKCDEPVEMNHFNQRSTKEPLTFLLCLFVNERKVCRTYEHIHLHVGGVMTYSNRCKLIFTHKRRTKRTLPWKHGYDLRTNAVPCSSGPTVVMSAPRHRPRH